jgi:hypothetical protein
MKTKLLAILLAMSLFLPACSQDVPQPETGLPDDEQISFEAVDFGTSEKIESNLSILRLESFKLPAEAKGWEERKISRYYKNDTLLKLVASMNDDSGSMSGEVSFYFSESGQLLGAIYPFNTYIFISGELVGVTDENGDILDFADENLIEREAYAYQMATRYAEIEENFGYDLKTLEFENGNIRIRYPAIENFRGELLQDYMNQSLYKYVELFSSENWSSVDLDYEVTYRDENYLSIVFTGTGEIETLGREVNILKSVTLDLGNTSNEITFDNFVDDPEGLKSFLEGYMGTKLEYEGLGFYFAGPYITFYFMPLDDSAEEFTKLSAPMDLIEPYVSWEFGDRPAS